MNRIERRAEQIYQQALRELKSQVSPTDFQEMKAELRQNYYPQILAMVGEEEAKRTSKRGFQGQLRPDQQEDMEALEQDPTGYLASDVGMGKTVVMLALMERVKGYKVLILAKKDLMYQWAKAARRFLPSRRVTVLDKTERKPVELLDQDGKPFLVPLFWEDAEIYICPEPQALEHLEYLKSQKFKTLVVEEAHRFRNKNTRHGRAAHELGQSIPRVHLLSATPAPHAPGNLRHQLTIQRKELPVLRDVEKGGNSRELVKAGRKLRNIGFYRRTNEALGLPPLERSTLNIPLNAQTQADYELAETQFMEYLRSGANEEMRYLAAISQASPDEAARLREYRAKQQLQVFSGDEAVELMKQLESLPKKQQEAFIDKEVKRYLAKARQAEGIRRYTRLRMLAGRGKVEGVAAFLEHFLKKTDRKFVLLTKNKVPLRAFKERFGSLAVIHDGSMSSLAREKAKESFSFDPSKRLFLATVDTAKEGLDGLQMVASDIGFAEMDWSADDHKQAEGRVHRYGQKAGRVDAWYFLAQGTIDEDQAALLERKRLMSGALIDLDPHFDDYGTVGFGENSKKHAAFGALVERRLGKEGVAYWTTTNAA